jgi:hypothetical protein
MFRVNQLADRTATDEVHNAEQNNGTNKGNDERRNIDPIAQAHAAHPEERAGHPFANHRPNDADYDVHKNALLRIRVHHFAGKPADNSAQYQTDDKIHIFTLQTD